MTTRPARFAWVLNLDAEFELSSAGYTPSSRLLAQLAQHGGAAQRLLGPDDVIVAPATAIDAARSQPDRAGDAALIGRAWCPTPRALARLAAARIEPEPHPPADVLRRVNHRRFAFELGGGLPGQRYVEHRTELESALSGASEPLLLKRPLAFAGRGQMRVFSRAAITAKEDSWIAASLRQDGLIVEPLVVPTLELSLHGFLWRDGRHELGHICMQEVSERGVFRSVRRAEPDELSLQERAALLEQGERVAFALALAGYFGPFGIDGYRYRSAVQSGFCALGEINARYTMAFTIGFPRHPIELIL